MELTPREKDRLLIFTAALLEVTGTRVQAPLYIPHSGPGGCAWN